MSVYELFFTTGEKNGMEFFKSLYNKLNHSISCSYTLFAPSGFFYLLTFNDTHVHIDIHLFYYLLFS